MVVLFIYKIQFVCKFCYRKIHDFFVFLGIALVKETHPTVIAIKIQPYTKKQNQIMDTHGFLPLYGIPNGLQNIITW